MFREKRLVTEMISRRHWYAGITSFLFAFSSTVSADGETYPLQGENSEDAIGVLQAIGAIPGPFWRSGYESGREGHSLTVLPDGDVVLYGAVPSGAIKDGEIILNSKVRIDKARSATPVPLRWDTKLRVWKEIGRPAECQYTSYLHTATLLPDNRILFAGGVCDAPRLLNDDSPFPPAFNKTSLWNDTTRQWETGPSLIEARLHHTATLTLDGNVLLVGGEKDERVSDDKEPVLDSVEMFRAATDSKVADVVTLPRLHHARARHTATLLPGGRVLVAGGMDENHKPIASVELWDPQSKTWLEGPALNVPRYGHAAVLTKGGRLMVLGGIDQYGKPTSSVEMLDAAGRGWTEVAPLLVPLRSLAALPLDNGDVLVAGAATNRYPTSYIMLWQDAVQQWKPAGSLRRDDVADARDDEPYVLRPDKQGGVLLFGRRMITRWTRTSSGESEYRPTIPRRGAATVPLKDGRILIAGGRIENTPFDLAEIYDPAKNRFTLTGRMNEARMTGMPFQTSLSAVLIDDGRVVVAGGWVRRTNGSSETVAHHPEVWNPATGQWSVIKRVQFDPQERVYLGKLNDGGILFFASRELADAPISSAYRAFVWRPSSDKVLPLIVSTLPRANAAITILKDGRVLIVGGNNIVWEPEYKCSRTPHDAQANEDGDGCQDEAAHWQAHENQTAEIWDSRTGKTAAAAFPSGWRADSPQSLLLKNGNVVLVNAGMPRPLMNVYKGPVWLWDAVLGTWSQLPGLDADMNWPMTEMNDGAIVAWAPENVNPKEVKLLKPGGLEWEPLPRFPQSAATVVQMPSGQTLAISTEEPYVAAFDGIAQQWQLRPSHILDLYSPAAVELDDGRLAVIGSISGNRKIVQVWEPRSNTWHTSKITEGETTGMAVRLPSGKVMNILYGPENSRICEIWQPNDDSWQSCGAFAIEKGKNKGAFALGKLEDGRAAFVGAAKSVFVFDEAKNEWLVMQAEWNEMLYPEGMAVRADKPFLRLFDPQKNEWLDASVLVETYYSKISGQGLPRMLWDPKRKHWAYIAHSIPMGRSAVWLPDGCAISGPPFTIYDPVTGKMTEHAELELPWMVGKLMWVLSDGSVIVIGGDVTGQKLFNRKATCAGFVHAPLDDMLMPAYGSGIAAPAETKPLAIPEKGWREKVGDLFSEYKLIAPAVLVPLFLYFVLRSVISWVKTKNPESALTRSIKPTTGGRVLSWGVRVVMFGSLAVIIVPVLFGSARSKLDEYNNEQRKFVTPCRYVGTWNMNALGRMHRFAIHADGRFDYKEITKNNSVLSSSSGFWEVQGENFVWYYGKRGIEPDVNPILEFNEHGFMLQEMNGVHSQFELIEKPSPDTCTQQVSH